MKRILPGALVSLKDDAEVTLVKAQVVKRRPPPDGMMFDSTEKERLRERLEQAQACRPGAVYLVLTASVHRTLLLRPDMGRYMVALTTDVIDLGDDP